MIGRYDIGTRFFDEDECRYIEVIGYGCGHGVHYCRIDEMNEDGEFEEADTGLFTRHDLSMMKEV